MKVLIAAGGTGGHIYPGIAVAKEVLRREANSEILFVGTSRGLETKIVPANDFELALINSAGLKNVGLAGQLKGLFVLPKSFLEARRVIKNFQPDVVVGAGGYVSGPVLLMASLMRIPTLVMDSNALPGFTNRRLAPFVTKAALTFEEAVSFFGKKGIVTGNPVRKEFFKIEAKSRGEKTNLLIFGGSQGARAINNAMVEALKNLPHDGLQIVHQTGESDFETIRELYNRAGFGDVAEVKPYIANMVEEFAESDLIICRAGATSCAEIAAAGRAAILIPLPSAADDHQRKNAEAFERAGAAKMILQKDLTADVLANAINDLINAPEKISAMQTSAKKLAKANAAEATVELIEDLIEGKK